MLCAWHRDSRCCIMCALGRDLQQQPQEQALQGADAKRRQERAPRPLRDGGGGGSQLCAVARGAGGGPATTDRLWNTPSTVCHNRSQRTMSTSRWTKLIPLEQKHGRLKGNSSLDRFYFIDFWVITSPCEATFAAFPKGSRWRWGSPAQP